MPATILNRANARWAERIALVLIASMPVAGARAEGTWTALTNLALTKIGIMLLLPDGTVMANDSQNYPTPIWNRLSPDTTGHYVNGTWDTNSISPMHYPHADFASQVLRNGRVFVAGGEYGSFLVGTNSDGTLQYNGGTSAEIYDPVSNSWGIVTPPTNYIDISSESPCYSPTRQSFSDMISETLPDGRVLMAPVCPKNSGDTLIFDPVSGTWAEGGTLLNGVCDEDEASWVKLRDGSILGIDGGASTSQRYIPTLNNGQGGWFQEPNAPANFYYGSVGGYGEIGAAFLLPNGNAFFIGSTPYTGVYIPSTLGGAHQGTWVPGPSLWLPIIPGSTNLYPMGAPDGPAAMMVNGKILCALSIGTTFKAQTTYFYEFDYANTNSANPYGTFTQIHAPGPPGSYSYGGSTDGSLMLDLPDGTVLYIGNGSPTYPGYQQCWVYTPDGSPIVSGKPTITSLTLNADSSYHLTGTGLNGISEGAAFGDDAQMATDYPLVRLSNTSSGAVYYARTYNWSSTGIQTGGTPQTTEFALPTGLPVGQYSVAVVANGIASDTYPNTIYGPIWVDFNYSGFPFQLGTYTEPFNTLAGGVSAVVSHGTIFIKPGTTAEKLTINKPLTLVAVDGPATIGHP